MVAGVTCGLAPVLVYRSLRDMATCAVTPPAKTSSAKRRFSSIVAGLGAGVLQALGDFEGITLHAEVQVADPEPAQHVAHAAAGQKQVDPGCVRGRLHLFQDAVLVRAQVAFQHEHVVAHGDSVQALG